MAYYLAQSADVIGKVTIEEGAGIWYHATLRGDVAEIHVGKRSNIQDNAVVHGSHGAHTVIGADVTIGHGAIVHGCTIEDEVLVGMGSIILDHAHIGKHCIIGAGTMITKGKVIPEGSLVYGNPMKIVRQLTEEEIDGIRQSAEEYAELAKSLPAIES